MVSVIVLSYNRCSEVLFTINKLKGLKASVPFDLEIIIVDNASVDDTTLKVKEKFPDVTLITKKSNNGIAGWNEGFKIARYKYFVVLDDDSHIESGFLEAINYMEQNEAIGILDLNIVGEDLKKDPYLPVDLISKDKHLVIGFTGCGAIIRKKVYEDIGGFADWIYVYSHEYEYGIRCLNAGYQIHYFTKGIVVHRTSKLNRSNKRMRIFSVRNEMGIVHKYFCSGKAKYILRILINNLKFMKREGLLSGYYILKGYIAFLKLRKNLKPTPVKKDVQNFFADKFWATKPIFSNMRKRLIKISFRQAL